MDIPLKKIIFGCALFVFNRGLYAAEDVRVNKPYFALQTMAVQQESFGSRVSIGFAPLANTEVWYRNWQLLLGGGVAMEKTPAHEDEKNYQFIVGMQAREVLIKGIAIRTLVQEVNTSKSGTRINWLEGLFALSLGEERGITIDFGFGGRWFDKSRNYTEEINSAYDTWRLFPALSIGYLF